MIAENAGQDGGIVCETVLEAKGNHGYNAATDVYEDLVKAGVIDPTKVTRTALANAASVATLLLTSDALIAEKPKEDEGARSRPRRRLRHVLICCRRVMGATRSRLTYDGLRLFERLVGPLTAEEKTHRRGRRERGGR